MKALGLYSLFPRDSIKQLQQVHLHCDNIGFSN